jgi:hypothetical protein
MIQQGEWADGLTRGLRPDEFNKKLNEEIQRKVPEEFADSLHIWLETRINPYTFEPEPGIRFQWQRPMTADELKIYEQREIDEQAERLKRAGVTPEMWAARRELFFRLKKEFGDE